MYEGMFKRTNIQLADEIDNADSRGNSITSYANQPIKYPGEIHEAARKRLVFLSAIEERKLEKNHGQYLARYVPIMDDSDDISFDSGEGIASDVSYYSYNEPQGVPITPVMKSKYSRIGDDAVDKNSDNIDERQIINLSYGFADLVDKSIASALTAATEMSNTVRGAQLIYAGKKTADSAITSADIMTIGLINEAETRLGQKEAYYWNSTVKTLSALAKNPWPNDPEDDPFVLIIGKDQRKAFRENNTFINYNQYGGDTVRLTGEIGRTLFGARIVVSDNIPVTKKGVAAWDTTTNSTVDLARCFLVKGMAAYVHVWGREAQFTHLEDPYRNGTILKLKASYSGSVLHADAIVKLDVATGIDVY